MKKHFLILFLMALLPLAGFAEEVITAVDISGKVVAITLQSNSPVYNNAVQAPTITKVVVDGVEYTSEWTQFFTPKYYKKNLLGSWIPQNADQIQDAGEYAVAIVANGAIDAERVLQYTEGKESPEANRATYTIQKKDLQVNLVDREKQYGDADPTSLTVTPIDLPTGWTTPDFLFKTPLPRAEGEAVSSTGYAYDFTLDDNSQDDITSVNYNVIIKNQPKLIITKKAITLNYIGENPSKVYGVETLNEEFLADIINPEKYVLADLENNELVDNDNNLATVLAGIIGEDKVTREFNYAGNPATESANAQPDGAPLAEPAEHKLTISIDPSVATNYTLTVQPVSLTVKQAVLSAAEDAPFTFEKDENEAFTYNGENQNLTKTVTYTANNEVLLQDGSTTVAPQVVVTYKFKLLDQEDPANVDAGGNTKAAGIYEAYIAPTSETGNFATEGNGAIRVEAFDFTITKKALYVYVTEGDIEKVYKGEAYTLPTSAEISFQGLTTADAADATIGEAKAAVKAVTVVNEELTDVDEVKAADTYTIIPAVNVDDAAALHVNYDVQPYESTFKVSPLAITIDPNDKNVVYGTAIAGTTAATVANVTVTKDNDDDPAIKADDKTKVISAYNVVVADQTYAAGQTYEGAITLEPKELNPTTDAETIALLANFDITPATGNVIVGDGTYSIVVKDKNKTYGDALAWTDFDDYLTPGLTGDAKPSVKYIIVNNADEEEVYSQNDDATKLPKNAGTYTVKVDAENSTLAVGGFTAPNEANIIAGTLTIDPKPITITINDVKLNTGDDLEALNKYATVADYVLVSEDDEIAFTYVFASDELLTDGALKSAENLGGLIEDGRIANAVDGLLTAATEAEPNDNANYLITFTKGAIILGAANSLVLDTEDTQLAGKIGDANGNANVSFANLTMKINEWYAMVLPFAINPLDMVKKFDRYVIFNELNTDLTNDQNIKFTLNLEPIPAGTPFLVKFAAKTGDEANTVVDWADITFPTIAINSTITDVENDYITFTGSYTSVKLQGLKGDNGGEKVWWLGNSALGKKNTWLKPKTNARTTLPMEAYLIAGDGWDAYAPNFTVEDFDGQTTAIKSLSADQINNLNTDGLYNLQGVKIQGAAKKGIYIQNGKKIVVK